MTIKELKQYRSICHEIDEKQSEINSSTVCDTVVGSDAEYPFNKRPVSVGGVERSNHNARTLERLKKLEQQRQDIEDFVNAIPDSLTRRIFEQRYIKGDYRPSWQRIANNLGGTSEYAVKHTVYRYISK